MDLLQIRVMTIVCHCMHERYMDHYHSQDCLVKQESNNYLLWCSYPPSNTEVYKHISSWRWGSSNKDNLKLTSPFWCGTVSFNLEQFNDMTYCNMRVSTIGCILFGALNAHVLKPLQHVKNIYLEAFSNLHIDGDAFYYFRYLKYLVIKNAHLLTNNDMSVNIKLNWIYTILLIMGTNLQEKLMLSHSNDSTQHHCKFVSLSVKGNITHIPDGYFKGCYNAKFVDFSYNQIQNLTYGSLKGLNNLDSLILDHNWISYIEPTVFLNYWIYLIMQ